MYRPHAAREDTDLFPLLRSLVSPLEDDAMAEDFERRSISSSARMVSK